MIKMTCKQSRGTRNMTTNSLTNVTNPTENVEARGFLMLLYQSTTMET